MRKSNRAAAMAMEAVFFLDRFVGLGCIHDKGGLSQTPAPYRRHVVGWRCFISKMFSLPKPKHAARCSIGTLAALFLDCYVGIAGRWDRNILSQLTLCLCPIIKRCFKSAEKCNALLHAARCLTKRLGS